MLNLVSAHSKEVSCFNPTYFSLPGLSKDLATQGLGIFDDGVISRLICQN
jgi:hypothetical protein